MKLTKFAYIMIALFGLVAFILVVDTAVDYILPVEEWKVYELNKKIDALEKEVSDTIGDNKALIQGIKNREVELDSKERELQIYQLTIKELIIDTERLREEATKE